MQNDSKRRDDGPGANPSRRGTEATIAGGLRVPDSLQDQLWGYRRQVWRVKATEACSALVALIALCILVVFAIDRVAEAAVWFRYALLGAMVVGAGLTIHFLARWLARTSGLEKIAILLGGRLPGVGDALLGVIELSHNRSEQSRSPALCQAAIAQVAEDASRRDFSQALPLSQHRWLAGLAAIGLTATVGLLALYPAATSNAMARLFAPWNGTPRYTFTRVTQLPQQWIVPHGEPVELNLALMEQSRWQPATAKAEIGAQRPIETRLVDDRYAFVLPPQIESQTLVVSVGDSRQVVNLKPTLRPELASIQAMVRLPDYLGQSEPLAKDVRGGTLAVVKGSHANLVAAANRPLARATVNGVAVQPQESVFRSSDFAIEESANFELSWRDQYDLTGREPFSLDVIAVEDEAPTLLCDGLARQAVVLDSEVLKFQIRANDDFGVQRVGISWRGIDPSGLVSADEGERVLAAGGHDQASVDALATFSAAALDIQPQPIELFVWAEDYLPGRPRSYSSAYTLFVLTADQHAIWITEQLSKWHRQALEVRDRELQLYEINKELRELSADQLNDPETREKIQRQAQAEKSNGRRLDRLTGMGKELVLTASRNPEIGVGHIERWAEMLQILDDISQNRMPSVAALLDDAASSPRLASGSAAAKPAGPSAGQIRAAAAGAPAEIKPGGPQGENAPTLVDMESSQNSPSEPGGPGAPKKASKSALRLPTTTLMGKGDGKQDEPKTPPAESPESLDPAVKAQEDLLAEFDKVADELNAILANLEGSTLVKRLKAAARTQNLVAGRIAEDLDDSFGKRQHAFEPQTKAALKEMVKREEQSIQDLSYIMDDMAAYFERRRFAQFKQVLDEMREEDVIGSIRQLTEEIPDTQGLSIAQCEYWSDTLDRWAEDLVDPACSGQCPGGASPESLPPSIVLEVLQILEAEINLREETRVAHQASEATTLDQHMEEGLRLSQNQIDLQQRIVDVIHRIGELTDAEKHFGKELAMLAEVDVVMGQAGEILAKPDCGPRAIAAETEAIELLLRSKRINPKSGGGGGSSPGGGGTGETNDVALALLGSGVNQKEVREDRGVQHATGESGTELPEEFRAGLDEYFNRIDASAVAQ
jgi:hypothetical protein